MKKIVLSTGDVGTSPKTWLGEGLTPSRRHAPETKILKSRGTFVHLSMRTRGADACLENVRFNRAGQFRKTKKYADNKIYFNNYRDTRSCKLFDSDKKRRHDFRR